MERMEAATRTIPAIAQFRLSYSYRKVNDLELIRKRWIRVSRLRAASLRPAPQGKNRMYRFLPNSHILPLLNDHSDLREIPRFLELYSKSRLIRSNNLTSSFPSPV